MVYPTVGHTGQSCLSQERRFVWCQIALTAIILFSRYSDVAEVPAKWGVDQKAQCTRPSPVNVYTAQK